MCAGAAMFKAIHGIRHEGFFAYKPPLAEESQKTTISSTITQLQQYS